MLILKVINIKKYIKSAPHYFKSIYSIYICCIIILLNLLLKVGKIFYYQRNKLLLLTLFLNDLDKIKQNKVNIHI